MGPAAAERTARAIAREQTLEVPEGVAPPEVEARLLGRVQAIEDADDGCEVVVSFAPDIAGDSLPQLLNALAGNVTLMDGVRLVDARIPDRLADRVGGPSHGIAGLRAVVGAPPDRPLVAVALKPVGLDTPALVELAETFARAGVDVIKDDHGLWDPQAAPFGERVPRIAEAVARARGTSDARTAYFPHVSGPVDRLLERAHLAARAGCAGAMLCPSLTGLDAMRWLAGPDGPGLALLAHPSHADTGPDRLEGIAPEVLLGTFYRLAGADGVIYVNERGRFRWPPETCAAINRRLREPLGACRPAMPTPAGGVEAADAPEWFERYGADTMLLIGGSLLHRHDVEAATREVVAAAHALGARTVTSPTREVRA